MIKKVLLFTLVFGIISCTGDIVESVEATEPVQGAPGRDDVAISLDYDAETVSVTKPENSSDESKLTPFDKISMQPKVHREKVSMRIYMDGSSRVEIEKKTPKHPLEVVHDELPDNSPQVVYTVMANDRMSMYDKNRKMIGKPMNIKMSNYSELIKNVKKGKNLNFSDVTTDDVAYNKDSPKKKVKGLGGGRVKITTQHAEGIGVVIIDTINKVTIGNALYGNDKRLKSGQTFQHQKNENGEVQLMGLKQKVLSKTPQGIPMETRNSKVFYNYKMTNHIKKD